MTEAARHEASPHAPPHPARRRRRHWYPVLALVLCGSTAATAWLLGQQVPTALAALDPPAVPVTAPVQEAELTFDTSATLSATYATAPALISSGRSGTITGTPVRPGTVLTTGTVVYVVDGVPVRAYTGEDVFFRPLALGDRGPDVTAAQRLLKALLPERRVAVDGVYSTATERHVRAYEKALGAAESTGVLDPTWFVRLPHDQYIVASTTVVLGAPAPAGGDEVATAAPALSSASLLPDERSDGPDGQYTFVYAGAEVAVERAADTWTVVDLESAYAVMAGADMVGATASREGRLRVAEPLVGQGLPPSAVVLSDDRTRTCTVVVTRTGYEAVQVELVGTAIDGAALVRTVLDPGSTVLLNPGEVAPDVTCP